MSAKVTTKDRVRQFPESVHIFINSQRFLYRKTHPENGKSGTLCRNNRKKAKSWREHDTSMLLNFMTYFTY